MQLSVKIVAALLLFSSINLCAQVSEQDSIARERISINKTSMTVLGAWAAANIVQGSISAANATGSGHYLHEMNAYFNTVNLALAGINLLMVKKQMNRHYTLADNIREQHKLEKIFLFNAGLDIGYLATGLYLKERGMRRNNDKPIGYGNSLLIQGSFLLIFDIVNYAVHRKNGKWLEQNLSNWQLSPAPNGIALTYNIR